MDFRGCKIGFREADRFYAELERQHEARIISDEEFDAQLKQLMAQDDGGRWWAKFGEFGEWHYRDAGIWVQGTPPDYQEVVSEPMTDGSLAQAPFSPRFKGVENENDR